MSDNPRSGTGQLSGTIGISVWGQVGLSPEAVIRILLGALIGFLGMAWSTSFMPNNPAVPLILPSSIIALIMAFRFGGAGALGAAAAHGLGLWLFSGASPMAALIASTGLGAAGLAGGVLLARMGFDGSLETVRSFGQFVGVGLSISAAGSAVASVVPLFGLTTGLPKALLLCWISDAMGVILFGPVGLLLTGPNPSARQIRYVTLWATGSAVITYGIYAGHLDATLARPISYALFPLMMIVAYKGGYRAATGAIAAIAVVAITCTAQGKGPFAHEMLRPNILALHANLLMLALTGLTLAIARHQQRDAEATTHRTLLKLARANRLDALATLAAGIAHEINQPLTSSNAYGRAACRLLPDDAGSEPIQQAIDGMIRSNERAAAIVRQFRAYLRETPDRFQMIDGVAAIKEAISLIDPDLSRQNIERVLSLPDDPVPIHGNAVGIQQIVINLIQNAADAVEAAHPHHGGRIDVRAQRSDATHHLRICVNDNGQGLPDGQPDRLFEPLECQRPGGSGLGLAICRSIVELHGGSITAQKRPTGGAEFIVELPLAET
ncbi:ATP-binding protein [Spiribacter sp. 1M153]|uniref:ATP-binding protein n=1 Tax=Spiribacter roseus TaxID=1855875 RepID=UPI00349F9DF0